MAHVWINGRLAEDTAPVLMAKDRGFLYGDGLFETLRAYEGRVFQLEEHWARLMRSAAFLRLPVAWGLPEITEAVERLIETNGLIEAVVRIALSRGAEAAGLGLVETDAPTVLIQARSFEGFPDHVYRRGVSVVIARIRQNADSPLPRHKTANYLLYLLARQEARDAKANDALLLNQRGQVCEATVANVFWVREGKVWTPPVHCGLLPGITRANVVRIAETADIPVGERAIMAGDLFDADEVFLTNSLMEITPVRTIDGRRIGEGSPGPVTTRLMGLYRDRESWS